MPERAPVSVVGRDVSPAQGCSERTTPNAALGHPGRPEATAVRSFWCRREASRRWRSPPSRLKPRRQTRDGRRPRAEAERLQIIRVREVRRLPGAPGAGKQRGVAAVPVRSGRNSLMLRHRERVRAPCRGGDRRPRSGGVGAGVAVSDTGCGASMRAGAARCSHDGLGSHDPPSPPQDRSARSPPVAGAKMLSRNLGALCPGGRKLLAGGSVEPLSGGGRYSSPRSA